MIIMELTPVDVSRAIKDWIRKEYGKEADEVIFHIRPVIQHGEVSIKFVGASAKGKF